MMEEARKRGVDIVFDDYYVYRYGKHVMTSLFPPWAQEGGTDGLIWRLKDKGIPGEAQREVSEWGLRAGPTTAGLAAHGRWDLIWIFALSEKNRQLEGKNFDEIARLMGKEPFDALLRHSDRGDGSSHSLSYRLSEEVQRLYVKHPLAMVGLRWLLLSLCR